MYALARQKETLKDRDRYATQFALMKAERLALRREGRALLSIITGMSEKLQQKLGTTATCSMAFGRGLLPSSQSPGGATYDSGTWDQ